MTYLAIVGVVAIAVTGMESVKADELETVISEDNFPDENLRKYVAGFDTDGSGSLSSAEIDAVTSFEIPQKTASLEGMQIFSNLEKIENECYVDEGLGDLYVDEIDFTCFPKLNYGNYLEQVEVEPRRSSLRSGRCYADIHRMSSTRMKMIKSAKIPSSKTIFMDFCIVTVKLLNSYEFLL